MWTRGCSILTMKLKIRVVLDDPCDDDYDDLWASLSTVRWSKMKRCDRLNFDTLIIQYNAAIRKVNQIPLCTPILTFAPPFWHLVRPLKKGQFWHPKKGKTGPKKRDIFRIHIGVDFLQKTGPKLLKICPCGAIYILQQLIWGRHPVPCLSTQISKRQGTAMY